VELDCGKGFGEREKKVKNCYAFCDNFYWEHSFLGEFAKLRKATISFVMSVCPSARPHEQLGSYWTDFNYI
jgi:hypothetical protein